VADFSIAVGLGVSAENCWAAENQTDVCPVKSVTMTGMKLLRNIIIVLALAAVALATSACPEKGPAEKAGEKIDNAIDNTKDAAKDATK